MSDRNQLVPATGSCAARRSRASALTPARVALDRTGASITTRHALEFSLAPCAGPRRRACQPSPCHPFSPPLRERNLASHRRPAAPPPTAPNTSAVPTWAALSHPRFCHSTRRRTCNLQPAILQLLSPSSSPTASPRSPPSATLCPCSTRFFPCSTLPGASPPSSSPSKPASPSPTRSAMPSAPTLLSSSLASARPQLARLAWRLHHLGAASRPHRR